MKKIGVLAAGRMGQLSQSFCLQKMREAGISVTVVYAQYYSSGVLADYKVSSVAQLETVLKGFDDEDVVVCSNISRAYRDMVRYGCPARGMAKRYSAHLDVNEFALDRKALDRALGGESMVFSVGSMRCALGASADMSQGQTEDEDEPACENNAGRLPASEYEGSDTPALTVVFLTHNRTAVACHCLDALCRNLKYSGRLRYCICDDRSDAGHVEALRGVLSGNGVVDYVVRCTTKDKWGLGASMNNGLREAFSVSPVVLTVEDDFLMVKPFDITGCVRLVVDNDIAGIRLAHLRTRPLRGRTISEKRPSRYRGFFRVVSGSTRALSYVFNNQVMLRHRRVYDRLGLYTENVSADASEDGMARRYNSAFAGEGSESCAVLYPVNLMTDTLSNGLFTHIGNSTQGHSYTSPHEYAHLNTREADKRAIGAALSHPESEDPVSVVYVCDSGAVAQAVVSAYSVLRTSEALGGKAHIDFVCGGSCADAAAHAAEALKARFGFDCAAVAAIPDWLESKCLEANRYTGDRKIATATYTALTKFELPNLLSYGKALFLDCDTLVVGDVFDLFSESMGGKGAMAVSDVGFVAGRTDFRGGREYFNSGVMLLDLDWMRRTSASEALWKAKKMCGDQTLVDQNAFNMVMKGHVRLIGPEYNSLVGEYCELLEKMGPATMLGRMNALYGTRMASVFGRAGSFASCSRVLHFAGRKKPWNAKSAGPMTWCLDEWRQVLEKAVQELPGTAAMLEGAGCGI